MTVTAASAVQSNRQRRVPGGQGTWVFLLGDMLVFGVFFATFLVERSTAPDLFDASRKTLHVGVGLTNTLVLLVSSLCVVVAIGAIRAGVLSIAALAVAAAMVCGLTFIGLKAFEYTSAVTTGHGAGSNHSYLYYFILTGLHLFHVCVSMLVLTFLLTQTRRTQFGATRMAVIEGGACFWHLVDLLWMVLFPCSTGELMTGPSAFQFIRNRAGLSWLILIAATLVSFAVGAEHGTGAGVVVVVLAIAAIKVRLVGLDFMELRDAPKALRSVFEGYCVLLWVALSGPYLFL